MMAVRESKVKGSYFEEISHTNTNTYTHTEGVNSPIEFSKALDKPGFLLWYDSHGCIGGKVEAVLITNETWRHALVGIFSLASSAEKWPPRLFMKRRR